MDGIQPAGAVKLRIWLSADAGSGDVAFVVIGIRVALGDRAGGRRMGERAGHDCGKGEEEDRDGLHCCGWCERVKMIL